MKTWHKVAIGSGVVVVLGGIVLFSVNQANKGMVTVQTAKVTKQDSLVSLVTASGEIKPTTYTNIAAQGYGRIRSEEHTSELQSRLHLVCRLLLEKKNIKDQLRT